MSTWKRDAASGLVVLVPIIVTIWVVWWLFRFIANLPLIENQITNPGLRVALTLVLFALLVLAVGYLMRTALGSIVEAAIDDVMNQVPGLRVVYNASKMGVETALTGTTELQEPVKVFTWDGIRMTAFKTGREAPDGRKLLFLPTAPNITSGFVIEVEAEDLIETDETVEEALTRILSAGFGERDRTEKGIPIDVIGDDGSRSPATGVVGDRSPAADGGDRPD
ncbi:DUF502 domain-containing protein [Natronorarus salvus]|uniref:DUF502 domain-containing protein n=1 Tax=Natronorarus salvus TaxID=3117733 RepID=UPI002F267849